MQRFEAWLRQPEVYFEFHKSFNDNESITATPWKLAGREYTREVVAHLPVKAPAWFRKAIGPLCFSTVMLSSFSLVLRRLLKLQCPSNEPLLKTRSV